MSDMGHEREQLIRGRAYALWDADGRPDGRAEEYWEMARQEVEAAENVALDAQGRPSLRLAAADA